MAESNYIGIDLFAGAGGLSSGLSQAGFDMKLGIEIDSNSATTLNNNNPNMNVVVGDIRDINPTKAIESIGLEKKAIDIIAGGPPCQGFSQSNRRSRNSCNPLNNLYVDFFRFVKIIRPPFFLFENVAGLKTLDRGAVLNDIINMGEKLGYNIQWKVVNAIDFGVPQRRNRIIILGSKQKSNDLFYAHNHEVITIRDALDDLPFLENGNKIDEQKYSRNSSLSNYQKLMRKNNGDTVLNNLVTKNNDIVCKRYEYIPEGGNWKHIPLHLMSNYKNVNNCHGWIYYRLKWDESSVVISNFRKNMLIHPKQHRGLSVREAARLQSFPDHNVFYGTLDSQQQQVANAVPPLMTKQIGRNIIQVL